MPLLKFWNSIRGRSASPVQQPTAAGDPIVESVPTTVNRPSREPRLSLFGVGQSHAALRKLVKPLAVRSVLEISVGDGSRAIAVLQTLEDATAIRYFAIDQFEMAGGAVTLKAFHQTMRAAGIRPQVFPEPMDRGLVRVAHTVGAVDLVIIAAEVGPWQTPEVTSLLKRVTHASTAILFEEEGSWQRFEPVSQTLSQRRAA